LWEQIGRALVSCANLPVAAIFGSSLAPGWTTTARYQFAQRARDRFIPLDQSARQRRGKIVNRA